MKNFRWQIPRVLAGTNRPEGLSDLQSLHKEGVRVLVSLTEEPLGNEEVKYLKETLKMRYFHFPVRDFKPPTKAQLEEFVELVRQCREEGTPVVVHCWAGVGRTGTFLAAYLISEGMSVNEAVDKVRSLFQPGYRGYNEPNEAQVDKLREFARQ